MMPRQVTRSVKSTGLAVDGERDVTEHRQVESGGSDDDVGRNLLTGADLLSHDR